MPLTFGMKKTLEDFVEANQKNGGHKERLFPAPIFFYSQNKAHFVTFPLPQSSRSHDEGPLSLSQAGKKHSHLCCRKQASGGTHLLHYRASVMELIRLNRRELVAYPFALTLACHCGAGSEHIHLGYHKLVVENDQRIFTLIIVS